MANVNVKMYIQKFKVEIIPLNFLRTALNQDPVVKLDVLLFFEDT